MSAEIDGRKLHITTRGEGEPMLLIQGMSGTHASWGDPFQDDLAANFEVVAYDHRGIGFSDPFGDPFSLADLADDAAGVLDAVGFDTAHVVGISMGGMVAQELALRHPDRIRTLTLGCTYCGGPGAALTEEAVVGQLAEAMFSGDRRRALEAGYHVNVSAAFAADSANLEPFLAMAEAVPAPLPTIMAQMQAIAVHDTSARLPGLDVPTLVIHGTEDRMLAASNGELIAGLIPGARLELLDGVGHMFWWEQPQRSAELIREHALAGQRA